MKHSDQETKQPSKQQEPICPVASKMQNICSKKSTITSRTAETHRACGKPFRPSLTTSPRPQACDDDPSLPDTLNHFYSRFEMQNDTPAQKQPTPPNDQALCLSPADVRKTLSRINPRKAAGPDNIPGRVLKDCAAQLTDVLTDIFNTLAEPGSRPHMSQIHNNHTGTKEITCVLSKRLPSHSTDSNHDEVL